MNNLRFQEFYRRRLPHVQVAGATYFVTFRLKNSLPIKVLENLSKEFIQNKKSPDDKFGFEHQWFEKFDNYLDQVLSGENYLSNPQIAGVVNEAIHYRDTKSYDLIFFCIMSNHIHMIFTPLKKDKARHYGLTEILHSLKRHTARQSNLILQKSGSFWQDESYDHVIRDENELEQTIKYVLYNPVKAKLVKDLRDWKWSYCKYDL